MPAGGTGWHFRRRLHAQKRTQRHSPATGSRLVDAFARRRSGVRLPCGPPLICRDLVLFTPSARLRKWPSATILQPKSVRLAGPCWGRLIPGGTAVAGGERLTSSADVRFQRPSQWRLHPPLRLSRREAGWCSQSVSYGARGYRRDQGTVTWPWPTRYFGVQYCAMVL